jgi:hypothetical protein
MLFLQNYTVMPGAGKINTATVAVVPGELFVLYKISRINYTLDASDTFFDFVKTAVCFLLAVPVVERGSITGTDNAVAISANHEAIIDYFGHA